MKKRLSLWCCALTAALATAGMAAYAQASTSLLIRANASGITVSGWRIYGGSALPSYAGAIAHLGVPQTCTLQRFGADQPPAKNYSRARWVALGATATFITYGLIPDGGDACSKPASVQLDALTLTGSRWRTDRGLQIGDPLSRLQRLYPHALPHNGTFWIVTRHNVVGSESIVPVFSVTIRSGHVASFRFAIGAQGD